MIIDFHAHAFPQKIAPKAMEKLSFLSGGLKPYTDGTLKGLKNRMKEDNVDLSVVLSIATNEAQQQSVNNFAKEIDETEGFIGFGSVFPTGKSAIEELERIKEMGLKGVKLHPDYQGFFVDDEKMKPIYKKISELGLITVFHAGVDFGFAPPYCATPERLEKALSWFESPVIAAHFGGLSCYEGVLQRLCGKENLYIDTSFSYAMLPRYYALKIIEKQGANKVLFGTDTPWHTAEMELRLIENLGLSDKELEQIKYKNACQLLNLKIF